MVALHEPFRSACEDGLCGVDSAVGGRRDTEGR